MVDLKATASITFFYYDSLEAADNIYANTLGLELVDDQEWTKIFRIQGNAYLGIVSGKRGFHRVQDTNAVLLTLVVQDVEALFFGGLRVDLH